MAYDVRIHAVEEQLIAAVREQTALGRVVSDIRWMLDAVWALPRERPELRHGGHNVEAYRTQGGTTSVECGA